MTDRSNQMSDVSRSTRRLFTALLILALPVFVLWLGRNSIWDANEAFYVDTPRQMIRSGDYITPMFNGVPRVNKPVLSYWVVAGLYHLLGTSVTAERLGIAIGIFGIVAAAFLLGRAVRSTATGVLAALIVATAPQVVMWGRRIFIDVHITMWMSLTLACFVLAERYPERRRVCLVLMYVAMGLGVLTKGPIAIVFPALTGAIWFTVERRWRDVSRLLLLPGMVIVLAIVVPWYAALEMRHGWGPVTGFFVGENLDRFTTSMQPDDRPFWFYLPVLFGDLFPWAPLLLIPLVSAWRKSGADANDAHAPIRRLLWLWVIVIVVTFSFSKTKQDLYIFPVTAAAAALMADGLVATGFGAKHVGFRILLVVAAVLSVAAGVVIGVYFAPAGYYALRGAGLMSAVLAVGGIATVGLVVGARHRAAMATLAITFVSVNYVFAAATLPSIERLKPVVPLADAFLSRASPTAQLAAYQFMLPSLVYYADRPVRVLESLDEARAFYTDVPSAWAIMDAGRFETLRAVVPDICVVARHPRLDPKLTEILSGRPPEDVLLVTNECRGRDR
jgi:4-amino-4-deoxy-L-arabinose transferase-like glycosyltransferase